MSEGILREEIYVGTNISVEDARLIIRKFSDRLKPHKEFMWHRLHPNSIDARGNMVYDESYTIGLKNNEKSNDQRSVVIIYLGQMEEPERRAIAIYKIESDERPPLFDSNRMTTLLLQITREVGGRT